MKLISIRTIRLFMIGFLSVYLFAAVLIWVNFIEFKLLIQRNSFQIMQLMLSNRNNTVGSLTDRIDQIVQNDHSLMNVILYGNVIATLLILAFTLILTYLFAYRFMGAGSMYRNHVKIKELLNQNYKIYNEIVKSHN